MPGNPLPGIAGTLINMYKGLYETGSTKSFFLKDMPAEAQLNQLRRLSFWTDLEKKYVNDKKC